MNIHLLLTYLRAAHTYGQAANPVTRKFCKDALKINDVDTAIIHLRQEGYRISVNGHGEIRLEA